LCNNYIQLAEVYIAYSEKLTFKTNLFAPVKSFFAKNAKIIKHVNNIKNNRQTKETRQKEYKCMQNYH